MSSIGIYIHGLELIEILQRFWTAVQALFHPTRLGLVEPPTKVDKEEWVLVYGGSGEHSAVNFTYAILNLFVAKVLSECSPSNSPMRQVTRLSRPLLPRTMNFVRLLARTLFSMYAPNQSQTLKVYDLIFAIAVQGFGLY